ncbi:MAG: beta-galactosidase [Prevotella sp.]|nr:beta-galactosidase [Prevotella sp.]
MKRKLLALLVFVSLTASAQQIADDVMQRIYQEVRTPYKYGLVVAPTDNYHKIDCPTVFQQDGKWLMTYVVYNGKEGLDGRGYETWLAKSDDLLHWQTLGRILSYKDDGWDMNQRGGFPALIDWTWGGSYGIAKYKNNYWMTYIGGHGTGYEAVREPLNIGMAWTKDDITQAHEWQSDDKPLMSINDKDAQWWEKLVQYKSTIYSLPSPSPKGEGSGLPKELAKYRFVMFYNAGGINPDNKLKAERIGIALSNDLKKWKRYDGNPVFANEVGGIITGDAQIAKMGDHYVMFYFKAYDPSRKYNAFNTFAVSKDLIHWQRWEGEDLIWPTKPYDEMFAHKSYVVKHDGVVYHFYCAVNNDQQRGIAVATSVPMGRSHASFPAPERKGRRAITPLNEGWTAATVPDGFPSGVNLPHNFDDYYGYRQLRHGNLHGKAAYHKTFTTKKQEGKRYFLQFEGAGTYATVTLNGHPYPEELVGRTVWTLDVTDHLRNGSNDLEVAVNHPAMQTTSPWVCGGCSSEWGFSEGSQPFGIFRPVSLIETDAIRIEPFGVHIWNNAACDSVFIETEVRNYTSQPQTIELVNKFTLASGKQVFRHASPVVLKAGENKTFRDAEHIEEVHRWSLQDPYLYTLTTMIKRDAKTTDEVRTPFGIRSVSWPVLRKDGDNRFLLNGQPVFINGTCEYEHLLGNSHAFTPEQIRSRIKQITNAGFNALREAHQPHNLLYQQLCDEQGLLFWSQFSAHIWYDTPQFRENFKRLLVRWIKERRNSPSVILWGLQNESVLPKDFAEECCDIIRSLDPTCQGQRAITTCNGGEGTDWNVIQNWSGTYGGSAENYDNELKRPDQLLNGEYGAWRTIDLHGDAKYSEESFTKLLDTKARLAEKAFAAGSSPTDTSLGVCGHFQWIFNSHDNPGRVQPDGAYRRIDKIGPINYKGLVTSWEEPTPAYYMYRQRYATKSPVGSGITAADRNIDLVKGAEGYHYLYRINCGGDAFVDEFGQQWQADDTIHSHSWGQDFEGIHAVQASQRHITADIRGTKSDELFQFFRFGRHRLWYDLPVPATVPDGSPSGLYRIELYFAEPWHGRDASETADYEGLRIFDVAVNGQTLIDDLDPWAEAGYCGALKYVVTAKADNGRLRISFPEVKAGQAVICGIAVGSTLPSSPQRGGDGSVVWRAFDTDTIAKLPKEELPKDTEARPASVCQPTGKSLTSFIIKPGLGQEYALRFRYKNTTGQPVTARMTVTDSKKTVLVDRDVTFPPTPNKFKMLSTTTGTQINAGTYTVRVDTKDIEFKELEIQ